MPQTITTICLSLPYHLGSVNCYLIETGTGFLLIDTGGSNRRPALVKELERAGCSPGSLKLIILTHGDFDHTGYGCEAKVLALPGHSTGSLGILTADGDLFSGDLLTNIDKPALNTIIDDAAAANASVERLKSLAIETVYPGHGKPFPMNLFLKTPETGGRSA